MGTIQKQAISGAVFSYIGVAIGFITTGLLLPQVCTPEENGLLKLLISYSLLFAQFATLGFNSVTSRMFTFFRNQQQQHHGFLAVALAVAVLGFLLSMGVFYGLKPLIIKENIDSSALFIDYINYLIPLIFFTLLFFILDTYYTVLFDAVIGIFLKEFLQRVFVLLSIGLFVFHIIDFHAFVVAYIVSFSLPTVIMIGALIRDKQFFVRPQWRFINRNMARSMVSVSLFGLLGSFSGIAVLQIDSVMVASMVSLEATGIYAITFFFGTLIRVPARSMQKISTTFIADAWKNSDYQVIDTIYKKSSITQFVVAVLLFAGIWGNIHNVFEILPEPYQAGKYVLFFIGLGNVIEMGGGVNSVMISTSKHYRVLTYLMIMLVGLIVITNLVFIPLLGLTGAAVASFISTLVYNLMRHIFVWRRFQMVAVSARHLLVAGIGLVAFAAGYVIPRLPHFILDIAVRSAVITVVFGILLIRLRVSEDINREVFRFISFLKQKLK